MQMSHWSTLVEEPGKLTFKRGLKVCVVSKQANLILTLTDLALVDVKLCYPFLLKKFFLMTIRKKISWYSKKREEIMI